MKTEKRTMCLAGHLCSVELIIVEQKDKPKIRRLFDAWRALRIGLIEFDSRAVNIPEGISESAFCLINNYARVKKVTGPTSGSFDAIELHSLKRIQIKATSVKNDLTSFGPKSVWDELYWLDFYRDGTFDGKYDVYKIPNHYIYDFPVNKRQTFKDQQAQGKRPRIRVRSGIIVPHGIAPMGTYEL